MALAKKQREEEKMMCIPPPAISESGRSIYITCQLQGIPEDEIRIDLEKSQLIVSTSTHNTTILDKIAVPEGSHIRQKKFCDGILEIILERPL